MGNIVAIVGRPNVGKSTLFNRLTQTRRAIVNEESGTTRDRQYGKAEWGGKEFSVIDTGGWISRSGDTFEDEIKKLERTISAFFDYIENIIERRQSFTMEEFAKSVEKFLEFNEYKILEGKGKISKDEADKKAVEEYREYNKNQPIESDFDKDIKRLFNAVKK